MKTKTLLTTVLAAAVAMLNAENITVGWPLYPVARELIAQYEKTTGKTAPELKLSNNQGASPNMRGPDGKETLGYLTMAPEKPLPGMIQIPVCSKGFFLYANTGNPFLERLGKTEIKPETMRKLWRGELSWEELTESREGRRTPVTAVVTSPQIPLLFGMTPGEKSRAVRMDEQAALKAVSSNRFAIGACGFDRIANEVIANMKSLGDRIEPLRFRILANGNYRLIRFGSSGGQGERLHRNQFGGILADGDFLRWNLVFQTKKESGKAFAVELAKAGNQLGMEVLVRVAVYPLKVEFPQKKPNDRKFVFTHAMQCFLLGGIPTGFADSYLPGTKTEDFKNWPPDIGKVRTWWSERLMPYVNTQTVDSARRDLDCAEAGGLDALGLLVYPGCLSENNPWNKGLRLMMQAAQTHKVKVLFDLWGTFPREWQKEARDLYTAEHGRRLRQWMEEFPDAFLKVNGKTVLCFGSDMTKYPLKAEFYEPFFKELGGREKYYLICSLTDSRAHNVFAGWEALGDISTIWFVHCGWGDKLQQNILLPMKARGDRLCWGVSPGYYRANFGRNLNAGNVTEGYGACKLMDDWRDAIRYNAGAVYAQSWNDMGEDHHLLESNFRGDTYLQLNRYFADWFRYGKEPEIRKEKIFLFHRRHLKDAKLERKDYRLATNPSWSSAPVTDYVHVVTMLKQTGDVKVRLGKQAFLLKDVQPGLREWLLLVPVKKDHQGNHPFWNAGAYDVTHPVNTEYRKVTELKKIEACVPEAAVLRNGKEVLKVVSRTGLPDAFRFQTFNVVGSQSK